MPTRVRLPGYYFEGGYRAGGRVVDRGEIALNPRPSKMRAVLRMADPITLPIPGAQPFQMEINLPFAPVAVRHAQLAAQHVPVDRPGRAPLIRWANPQAETVSFQAILVNDWAPGYADCEDKILWLRTMALLPTEVIFAYGTMSNGKRWRITEFSYETQMRTDKGDKVIRALADITLTESVRVGSQIVPGIQQIKDNPTGRLGAAGNGGASTPAQRDSAVNAPSPNGGWQVWLAVTGRDVRDANGNGIPDSEE